MFHNKQAKMGCHCVPFFLKTEVPSLESPGWGIVWQRQRQETLTADESGDLISGRNVGRDA
jgi:hypothetical protein